MAVSDWSQREGKVAEGEELKKQRGRSSGRIIHTAIEIITN